MRRSWLSVVVTAAFIAGSSSALASGAKQQGPLAPGHAIGVHKAQAEIASMPLWAIGAIGIGIIGVAVGIAASSGGHNSVSTTSTCGATGCSTGSTTTTSTSTTSTTGT